MTIKLSYGQFGASPRDDVSSSARGDRAWRQAQRRVADKIEAAVVIAAFAGFAAINGLLVFQAAAAVFDAVAAPVTRAA